jgi:hypothetical protein
MNQLTEKYDKQIEKLFPMPENKDILEEIRIGRLRGAFDQGVYFAYQQITDIIPLEDKTKAAGWNEALDEFMGRQIEFFETFSSHLSSLAEQQMQVYEHRRTRQ